jgi:Tol biopolymer transport system component
MRCTFRFGPALVVLLAGCSDGVQPLSDPAAIYVTNVTSGGAFDLDGFQVVVDGTRRYTMDVNDQTQAIKLTEGSHTIELTGLASNCSAEGPVSRPVHAQGSSTEKLTFITTCVPPAELAAIRIAFTHDEDDWSRLVSMNADGSERVRLTDGPADRSPTFSPDGARIAFIRQTGLSEDETALYVASADGRELRKLVDGADWPDWAPDGQSIVFSEEGRFYGGPIKVVPAEGGEARYLTGPDPAPADFQPRWAPDGTRVYFWRAEIGDVNVWSVASDGTGARRFESTGAGFFPVWAPDGKRFASVLGSALGSKVFVSRGDGSSPELVLESSELGFDVTDWSADGTMLLLVGRRRDAWFRQDVYLFDLIDRELFRLTAGASDASPVFWPADSR